MEQEEQEQQGREPCLGKQDVHRRLQQGRDQRKEQEQAEDEERKEQVEKQEKEEQE